MPNGRASRVRCNALPLGMEVEASDGKTVYLKIDKNAVKDLPALKVKR